ncbi:MAG: hypothetical protein NTX82_03950 [Candidatus Parcubacteria bacterium]|nr:hypothetical protein [Candidatus Parcubacteria bacterium]
MDKHTKGKGVLALLMDYKDNPEDKALLRELLLTAADDLEKLPSEKGEKDISWITCPEALKFIQLDKRSSTVNNFIAHANQCPFCRDHKHEIMHFDRKKISPQELAKIIKENL